MKVNAICMSRANIVSCVIIGEYNCKPSNILVQRLHCLSILNMISLGTVELHQNHKIRLKLIVNLCSSLTPCPQPSMICVTITYHVTV